MVRWWTITRTELVRLFRDRANIFWILLFPLLLVLLIGASFGGQVETRVGVVVEAPDSASRRLVTAIDEREEVETLSVSDSETLRDQVARGTLSAGLVIPAGLGEALAAAEPIQLGYVGRQDSTALALRAVVEGAVSDQATIADAAAAAAEATGRSVADTTPVAQRLAEDGAKIRVSASEVTPEGGLAREFAGLGQFDLGASTQLFLFTFLTGLGGGVALIQTRRYGVARRMLSTPTPTGVVLAGEAGGRIAVAVFQAAYIVVATWLLFRVDWGQPLPTAVVVLLFCLVAGGAGMLTGATLRNESQAGGVAVGIGLVMAALGGSMVPVEVFPATLRSIALVTPHAWANRAMAEIVRRDGGLPDILPEVGVLAAYAAVLLVLATILLRRTLTR